MGGEDAPVQGFRRPDVAELPIGIGHTQSIGGGQGRHWGRSLPKRFAVGKAIGPDALEREPDRAGDPILKVEVNL